jgi:hypothetical protein
MPDKPVWVVTWLPLATRGVRGRHAKPEQRQFEDLEGAVSFVMELDQLPQATATIRLPGGDAVGMTVIKQMHAAQKSAGN